MPKSPAIPLITLKYDRKGKLLTTGAEIEQQVDNIILALKKAGLLAQEFDQNAQN